jgi:chemotaxis protein methyltransferase CheR
MIIAPIGYAPAAAAQLSDSDYTRFNQLLQTYCGLHFPDKRRTELEYGLRHAFAASTCATLDEYYRLLMHSDHGTAEMDRLINAVTIGETHFFRDEGQFNALVMHVLPDIIKRRQTQRILRIWSAGCASGEEPYSLAMLLREMIPDVDEWSITILGTDINTEALDRAAKATYGEWAFREIRAKQLRPRYFRAQGNRYELTPEVRHMVTFARLNLAEDRFPAFETNTTMMDLILCRNVLIYFDEAAARAVIDRFYNSLLDGSWFVVGHSEPSIFNYRSFQARNFPDAILYQRTGQPTTLPRDWDFPTAPRPVEPISPVNVSPLRLFTPLAPTVTAPSNPLPVVERDRLELAEEYLEQGRSEEALTVLLKEAAARPDRLPACVLIGKIYADRGNWIEAERWCQRAIQIDRLAIDAYYIVALVYQHQGKLVEAIEAMKKVVYLDRNSILGHFSLADLHHSSNQPVQAQKSLDNVRRLLQTRTADELIPDSGGITIGRLRDTVIRRQQEWGLSLTSSGAIEKGYPA